MLVSKQQTKQLERNPNKNKHKNKHQTPQFEIGVSILSTDLSNLTSECTRIIESGADYLHVDIMDGHFVDNLTFGPPVVQWIRQKNPSWFLDCHLMVQNPGKWIEPMAKAGANMFTFHVESVDILVISKLIQKIKQLGMKCGLAVNPDTLLDLELIKQIQFVDQVLIMTDAGKSM